MRFMISLDRRMLRRIASIALLPAALGAQAITGTVSGRVTASGQGVPGATVIAVGTGRGTQTRSDGTYRLTLPAGRYELRARAVGYTSARDSVTITAGGNATANFTLERSITTLEAVSTLGTRGEARSVIDAPVPIDVLSATEIKATGRTETAQMIQALAPSFNFPRTSIGDGTDHVRPATLRGLAPDQALVLVNGKRRHQSALVNVNGFVGRGSSAVDLNAIPSSMIDHIEILRDGAAAQYGSDAIAGVLNIVLKKGVGGEARVMGGGTYTTFNRVSDGLPYPALDQSEVQRRDGKVFQAALDYGWSFGQNGYMHVAGELRDRGQTNRSLPDARQQYFAGDPKENNPAYPLPDGRFNHRQGDGSSHDLQGFWNGGTTLSNGIELYTFGGVSSRKGEATGFWRRPLDDRTLRNIYPDGFLPIIHSDITDASAAVGARGDISGWKYDLSGNYGTDKFGFTIKNSANVSLGPTSKTVFDAGAMKFGQMTANFDLFREFRDLIGVPLRVAGGAEARGDNYEIVAGEPDSWRNGGFKVIGPDGTTPTTKAGAPGSQVFPGFRADSGAKKGDAGVHTRNNVAGYVDFETDITKSLLFGIAGRVERYSDFGGTTTGKVSTRYQLLPGLALRGAASTGFRAPSLMQQFFSSTATNFTGGQLLDIRTFPVGTPEARALGARDLTAEKSKNYSAGIAFEPFNSFSITADYYFVGINDRIIFSENFTGTAVQDTLRALGVIGVQGVRYFTNAIDTKTEGVDIIANYGASMGDGGVLKLTAAYNHNGTRVTRVTPPPAKLSSEQLFGRVERARIELGNPKDNLILTSNYNIKALNLLARTQRFGEVTTYGLTPTNAYGKLDQTFSAKWVTDLSVGYTFGRLTGTIGSDNVFDVYPDRNSNPGNIGAGVSGTANFGIFPYAGISPFGFNGRFVYARVTAGL